MESWTSKSKQYDKLTHDQRDILNNFMLWKNDYQWAHMESDYISRMILTISKRIIKQQEN